MSVANYQEEKINTKLCDELDELSSIARELNIDCLNETQSIAIVIKDIIKNQLFGCIVMIENEQKSSLVLEFILSQLNQNHLSFSDWLIVDKEYSDGNILANLLLKTYRLLRESKT